MMAYRLRYLIACRYDYFHMFTVVENILFFSDFFFPKCFQYGMKVLGVIVLAISVNYLTIVPVVPITILLFHVRSYYMKSARQTIRIEAICISKFCYFTKIPRGAYNPEFKKKSFFFVGRSKFGLHPFNEYFNGYCDRSRMQKWTFHAQTVPSTCRQAHSDLFRKYCNHEMVSSPDGSCFDNFYFHCDF